MMNNCCSKEYGNVRAPVTDDYLDIYTATITIELKRNGSVVQDLEH